MSLSARAIRIADVWIIEIPSLQLRIPVADLVDAEQRVAVAIAAGHRNGRPAQIRVEIGQYLHIDDSSTEDTRRRRVTVAQALQANHRTG